ncbi:MAG: WG repeat-containing protein [Pseudomonadota bacterium]
MRTLLTTFFLLSACALYPGAAAAETLKRSCGGAFGLCGLVNVQGVLVVPRRFEKIHSFRHGLAAVRIEGLWGYIGRSGRIEIEPAFLAAGEFRATRAEATVRSGAGVIDRSGNFIIPPRFDRAIPFTEDVALVVKRSAKPAELLSRGLGLGFLRKPYRLYHRHQGYVTRTELRFRQFQPLRAGPGSLIWASLPRSRSPFGLMDAHGNWVLQPRFEHVQVVNEGLAVVRDGKWGAVDEKGRIAIPLKFDWLSYFANGHAIIGGPGQFGRRKRGLLRSDGKVVAEPEFEWSERPEKPGALPRVRRDGVWYFIDNGTLVPVNVTNDSEGRVVASCPQGLRVTRKAGRYVLTDAGGTPVLKEPFDFVDFGIANEDGSISGGASRSRELDCRAPIIVRSKSHKKKNLRSIYVRPNGRMLFEPPRHFSSVHRFHRGHAIVGMARPGRDDGEWGIIDQTGAFTLPPGPGRIYSKGRISLIAGRAIYARSHGQGTRLMDAFGRPVPKIEKALEKRNRGRALACGGGATIIGNGERFGIADKDGKVLVATVHRAISCFRSGVAWAPREDERQWCPIGPDGKFREAPACRRVYYPVTVTHHYPERFADDPFESSVLWLRAGLRYGLGLRKGPPGWKGDGVRSKVSFSVWPFSP